MAKQKFPRTKFQLTAGMNVREIVLTGQAKSSWGGTSSYVQDAKGKKYFEPQLFDSRAAAITAGEQVMADQEARLAKLQANVAKRRAAFEKAKGTA